MSSTAAEPADKVKDISDQLKETSIPDENDAANVSKNKKKKNKKNKKIKKKNKNKKNKKKWKNNKKRKNVHKRRKPSRSSRLGGGEVDRTLDTLDTEDENELFVVETHDDEHFLVETR